MPISSCLGPDRATHFVHGCPQPPAIDQDQLVVASLPRHPKRTSPLGRTVVSIIQILRRMLLNYDKESQQGEMKCRCWRGEWLSSRSESESESESDWQSMKWNKNQKLQAAMLFHPQCRWCWRTRNENQCWTREWRKQHSRWGEETTSSCCCIFKTGAAAWKAAEKHHEKRVNKLVNSSRRAKNTVVILNKTVDKYNRSLNSKFLSGWSSPRCVDLAEIYTRAPRSNFL